MTPCVCLEKCPFFNDRMKNMPGMSQLLKKKYCEDNWEACARYQVFQALGKEAVPPDLFPNQHERLPALLG